MSVTTPAQTPIVATAAIQRARAAVAKRAPSATRPPPDERGLRGGSAPAVSDRPRHDRRRTGAAIGPPRRISTGGRRAARHAGHVAAATTISTTPASAAASGSISEAPGGRSLSDASRPAAGPATASVPSAIPSAAAGSATTAASVA